MNQNVTRSQEVGEQFDDRDRRALEQYLTVLEDVGDVAGRRGEYEVVSESGSSYVVNTLLGACTCPDHEYRDVKCKHRRRVGFATGERTVPDSGDVAGKLGEHVTRDDVDGHEESESADDVETCRCECGELNTVDAGDDLECWSCFRDTDSIEVTTESDSGKVAMTDGGVTVREAVEDAELLEDDADPWKGPFAEYDKYGQLTDAKFYRCRDCAREVVTGRKEFATHREGCRFDE
ncbi:hypothetical protein [Natrinema soli]|uniref:SWIM-type domain-containing protein n=1 Tax=Natrinema soli TaxID=1930624 RepID=A0ABD5SGJ4_9EURY|nr:hypothetical protein [Natrinema soli]